MPNALIVNSSNQPFQEGMPLGPMTVATILAIKHDIQTRIVDLPVEEPERLEQQLGSFWDDLDPDGCVFVGFSSMCNTMPRSLSLARMLRERYPHIPIIFAGPEITSSFSWLSSQYKFIDAVVLGEAESVITPMVDWLNGAVPKNRPGLWIRAAGSDASPGMADLVDLDETPLTDYATYSCLVNGQRMAIEVGRGCPYACTFCSTKTFFKRRFRLKSTARIMAEIDAIEGAGHGGGEYDFVHDMFTTNRDLVVELCQALIERDTPIRWSCSSRTDRVDAELLAMMWRAGCRDIFFGLETGSARMQVAIMKKLDLSDAAEKVALAIGLGFNVTCALIVGFQEENEEDLAATIDTFLALKFSTPGLQSVQLHLLAPMSGTEIHNRDIDRLRYDGFLPAASSVNLLTGWEEQQIRTMPEAFSSFYYLRHDQISRAAYKWIFRFLSDAMPVWGTPAEFYAQYGQAAGRQLVALAQAQGKYPMDEVLTHRWTAERRARDAAHAY